MLTVHVLDKLAGKDFRREANVIEHLQMLDHFAEADATSVWTNGHYKEFFQRGQKFSGGFMGTVCARA